MKRGLIIFFVFLLLFVGVNAAPFSHNTILDNAMVNADRNFVAVSTLEEIEDRAYTFNQSAKGGGNFVVVPAAQCTDTVKKVLSLSDNVNAHGQNLLFGSSSSSPYNYVLCYTGSETPAWYDTEEQSPWVFMADMFGSEDDIILMLYTDTNSHALVASEETTGTSVSHYAVDNCVTMDTMFPCTEGRGCVIELSNKTNAHLAACGYGYTWKVCCEGQDWDYVRGEKGRAGEPCTANEHCISNQCVSSVCVGTSSPCTLTRDCSSNSYCNNPTDAIGAGTCTPDVGAGGNVANGGVCTYDGVCNSRDCVNSICVVGCAGQTCGETSFCSYLGSVATLGICVNCPEGLCGNIPNGDVCVDDFECESHVCNENNICGCLVDGDCGAEFECNQATHLCQTSDGGGNGGAGLLPCEEAANGKNYTFCDAGFICSAGAYGDGEALEPNCCIADTPSCVRQEVGVDGQLCQMSLGPCLDPDGDGVGTQSVMNSCDPAAPARTCNVLTGEQRLPAYSILAVLLTLVIIIGFYLIKNRKI